MKNKLLQMIAGLVMLGFSAGGASAGVLTMGPWDGSAVTGYNANFGNPGVGSTFSDSITFSIPVGALGTGGANTISLGGNGVIFTLFSLAEAAWGTVYGATGGTSSSLTFVGGGVPGSYTLSVAGYKINPALSGSYSGNINLNPVPEPETYAMLLAGLALVGFTARRRKNSAA